MSWIFGTGGILNKEQLTPKTAPPKIASIPKITASDTKMPGEKEPKKSDAPTTPPAEPATPPPEEVGAVSGDKVVEEEEERDSWGSKLAYVLTLVGYAVGFGNIWRFPFLLHSNGGIAFLIPYCIMLAFAGIPIFFLELAIGQRLKKGALGTWNEVSPYMGGLGIACGLTCFFVELYYNTLVAWVLLYLVDSFRGTLPWTDCVNMKPRGEMEIVGERLIPGKDPEHIKAPKECLATNQGTKYYWYRVQLDVSDGLTSPGNFNPWMLLMLCVAWLLVWGIILKGIKSSQKVVYFTALFPYIVLFIFFVGNFFMEGWMDGYIILLRPDFSVLSDANVWLRAGSQIFFSLGVAYGCLIVFASYLPSNNNCYRDAVSVSLINCGTSLLAALVLFPVFGALGTKKYFECQEKRTWEALSSMGSYGEHDFTPVYPDLQVLKYYSIPEKKGKYSGIISEIIRVGNNSKINTLPISLDENVFGCNLEKFIRASGSGTGLVFIGFAEAVLKLPFPPIWSILFFLMLLTLGIDSSFGTLEGAVAVLIDMKILRYKGKPWPRWIITTFVTSILFVGSLVFAWGWGMYIQVFIDQFVSNWSLLIIGFFETVGVAWVYGLAKFAYDVKLMTGSRPNMFMLVCWKFITPALILLILLMSIVQQYTDGYNYEVYNRHTGDVEEKPQPAHIIALGYIIWLGIILWVPIQAVLVLFGKSLLKTEKPAYFPEEELRAERQLGDDDEDFDKLDKMVMGKSIEDFKAYRSTKSRASLQGSPSPHGSVVELPPETQP